MPPNDKPPSRTMMPAYVLGGVNKDIELYTGDFVLVAGGKEEHVRGAVRFEWQPKPTVKFQYVVPGAMSSHGLGAVTVRIPTTGRELKGQITAVGSGDGGIAGSGLATQEDEGAGSMVRVVFHVPNFAKYHGTSTVYSDRGAVASRATMRAGNWRVSLDNTALVQRELYNELDASGGYAITAVGTIERIDGQAFAVPDVEPVLKDLMHFLSFIRGMWCAPQLPVGFSVQASRVWSPWRAWRTVRWRYVSTWFNQLAYDCLEELFPGFIQMANDETWGEPLKLAIYWYVAANCNEGGTEGSIILTQAALELLAWTTLVEDKKALSSTQFKRQTAAENIRQLLATATIPLDIPASLHSIPNLAQRIGWLDGPETIAGIRNALVHPSPKKREKILNGESDALTEAWMLGLWYVELLILHQCDYRGRYTNRNIPGPVYAKTEKVPWVH